MINNIIKMKKNINNFCINNTKYDNKLIGINTNKKYIKKDKAYKLKNFINFKYIKIFDLFVFSNQFKNNNFSLFDEKNLLNKIKLLLLLKK